MTTTVNLDRAFGREYVAAPWVVLPTDHQALIIGELSRHASPDWTLIVDPSREPAAPGCTMDTAHGPGLVRVNDGFPVCACCADKLLSRIVYAGEEVCVEVLREAAEC